MPMTYVPETGTRKLVPESGTCVMQSGTSFVLDRDTVCFQDSGGRRETHAAYSGSIRGEYCIVFIQHNTAI